MGNISSIIVDIKEDEDVTVFNLRVPLAPPSVVIGKGADVKEVMRAQLAVNPSLPKSLQAQRGRCELQTAAACCCHCGDPDVSLLCLLVRYAVR